MSIRVQDVASGCCNPSQRTLLASRPCPTWIWSGYVKWQREGQICKTPLGLCETIEMLLEVTIPKRNLSRSPATALLQRTCPKSNPAKAKMCFFLGLLSFDCWFDLEVTELIFLNERRLIKFTLLYRVWRQLYHLSNEGFSTLQTRSANKPWLEQLWGTF